ncbi:Clavaminate synthase-like protein [Daedaleopsis nitida]|nr:Clavaminate synthase-like protein [Daedaleopsis nitida]
MPAITLPSLPPVFRHVPPPTTTENLEWADLPIIDISTANTPEGRIALAPQMHDAMRTYGFLYIVNHGLTQAQNERMFSIADVPFSQVAEDEKQRYTSNIKESGSYRGYKLRQLWAIENGVLDQIEHYQFFEQEKHPEALQPYIPEICSFAEHNHYNVLVPILRLLALGMELPEDTFVDLHSFDSTGFVRFMKYWPRSDEDESKTKSVWLKGHTDIGTITILWSQPISGLQVMSPDGKWRWVRHIDNALVINIGDSMEMLSGGYYKATIHRVIQPPKDQRNLARLGIFYFSMARNDTKLVPITDAPVLQKEGVKRRIEDESAPTMLEWRRGIIKSYGMTQLKKKDEVIEEEIVEGIVVKHYN